MRAKLEILLFVKLFVMLTLILLITACSPNEYEIEIEVDNVDVVNVTFEYKQESLLRAGKDIIYIETEEQTYVINSDYYREIEFVKSDKSRFTEKHKVSKLMLDMSTRDKYVTIELDPQLMKSASSEYAKAREKTLDLKESSEIDI